MGEVPVPEVSAMSEPPDAAAASGAAPSIHDESDEEMGDHFGGPPSPMGGMRLASFHMSNKLICESIENEKFFVCV